MVLRTILSLAGGSSLAFLAIVAIAAFWPGMVVFVAAGSANKKATLDSTQRAGAVVLAGLFTFGWWYTCWLAVVALAAS